jgi:hypothetical protein
MLDDDERFSNRINNYMEEKDCSESCAGSSSSRHEVENTSVQLSASSKDGYLSLEFVTNTSSQPNFRSSCNVELHKLRTLDFVKAPDVTGQTHLTSISTPTATNFRLWNRWVNSCSESHKKCCALDHELESFVPSRLVEIRMGDDGQSFTWRLVSRANIGNVQYLTLSHCWGSSTHTSLRNETMSTFIEFSEYAELPKSFRDAFLITFSLGFRFIWIDSLCIIQDDPLDWESQASMMGAVYKNSRCNIAATWAEDGNGGCFTRSKPMVLTLDLEPVGSMEVQLQPRTLFYDDLMEAPLNRRGWVAQERFLARRQISFAESQVYWECQELVASEQYPAGIPKSMRDSSPYNQAVPPIGIPTLNLPTEMGLRNAWAALVDFYSDCKFSKVSDKMIALAGLAGEMRERTGDVYLAGIWKKDLRSQLCWATDFDVRWRANRTRVPIYLAPTWSWASVDGPVMSDYRYGGTTMEYVSCVEVLDASVHSKHISGLHSFSESRLVLRGIAMWAQAIQKDNGVSRGGMDDWVLQFTKTEGRSNILSQASADVGIFWDENMSGPEIDPRRWPSFLNERASDLL